MVGVGAQLNIATAFLAGLVSFVSPCVLPLIPAYLSFLTGSSLEELKAERSAVRRARVIGHALAFVAGFTVVFVALGFTAGAVGNALLAYRDLVAKIGGAVVIVLGLNMIGVFKIPFLMMDKRPRWPNANRSYAASFVVGLGLRGRLVALHRADPGGDPRAGVAAELRHRDGPAARLLAGTRGAVPR